MWNSFYLCSWNVVAYGCSYSFYKMLTLVDGEPVVKAHAAIVEKNCFVYVDIFNCLEHLFVCWNSIVFGYKPILFWWVF